MVDHSTNNAPLGKYFLAALLLATLVVVTIIMPAEYGKDPTGVGSALGLTSLSQTTSAVSSSSEATATLQKDENGNTVLLTNSLENIDLNSIDYSDPFQALKMGDKVARLHKQPFRVDHKMIKIELDGQIEVKALLEKGEMIVYSWRVLNGEVYTDFHGHPPDGSPELKNYPNNFYVRYDDGDGSTGSGSIVAPVSGEHGWYWMNISDGPITIDLQVSGFHSELKEIELGALY
jgi:hypothetical protein